MEENAQKLFVPVKVWLCVCFLGWFLSDIFQWPKMARLDGVCGSFLVMQAAADSLEVNFAGG